MKPDVSSAGKDVISKECKHRNGSNHHKVVFYGIKQFEVEKTVDGSLGTAAGAFEACELKERAFGKPAAFSRIETHIYKKQGYCQRCCQQYP